MDVDLDVPAGAELDVQNLLDCQLERYKRASSATDGVTGPGCWSAGLFTNQIKIFYKAEQPIVHLRSVLPSSVVFTSG